MNGKEIPPQHSPKKPLNELLGDFATLTDKQYLAARNAGFTSAELVGKTWDWFDDNHASLTSKNKTSKCPALPKQIQFLESLGYEIEDFQLYYVVLRAAITRHILNVENDERFRRAYEANRKDNQGRKYRSRKTLANANEDISGATSPPIEFPKIASFESSPAPDAPTSKGVAAANGLDNDFGDFMETFRKMQ